MARSASSPRVIDVAIVGGGVSGVYSAYRLKHSERKPKPKGRNFLGGKTAAELDIVVYEQSDRIGGRLWSLHPPGWKQAPIELGGMGFSKLQQSVYELCDKELGLDIGPCGFFNNQAIQYLRKTRFAAKDYGTASMVPYALDTQEVGKDPGTIMVDALLGAVEECHPLYHEAARAIAAGDLSTGFLFISRLTDKLREAVVTGTSVCNGLPVNNVGFWNILADVLSIEAFHLCDDSAFSPSYNFNWNLYDSFLSLLNVVFIYTLAGTQYSPFSRLKNGYQELPETLAAKFIEKGGKVQTETMLRTMCRADVAGESVIELTLTRSSGRGEEKVYARSVVLAMPKRAIELLDIDNVLYEGKHFEEDMNAVSGIALSKVYTIYDTPWWSSYPFNMGTGYSTTDLPLKAIYYINGDQGQENQKGVLLAALNDDRYAQFWDGYFVPSRFKNFREWFQSIKGVGPEFRIPTEMVREVQRQLKEVHGNDHIPHPIGALHFNWGQDPYGGGYHNWNPHFRSWEVMPRIRKPVRDANVFICGEAFSCSQGWVEGAINTAEKMLEDHFHLPRPDWVDKNYDFGP